MTRSSTRCRASTTGACPRRSSPILRPVSYRSRRRVPTGSTTGTAGRPGAGDGISSSASRSRWRSPHCWASCPRFTGCGCSPCSRPSGWRVRGPGRLRGVARGRSPVPGWVLPTDSVGHPASIRRLGCLPAQARGQRLSGPSSGTILIDCTGGVAQLVERYVRNVEVGGSSPLTSTPEVFTFRWGPTSHFEPSSSCHGGVTRPSRRPLVGLASRFRRCAGPQDASRRALPRCRGDASDYGGAVADAPRRSTSVLRRRRRVFGPRPAAARRARSARRASNASDHGLVAHDEGTGQEQAHRRKPHEPAPPPGDVDRGGVLDPGVGPLDGGASGIGAAPGRGGVVVALGGLGVDRGWDGDRLLRAARWGVLGRRARSRGGQVERHGVGRSGQRSLPIWRRAGDPG